MPGAMRTAFTRRSFDRWKGSSTVALCDILGGRITAQKSRDANNRITDDQAGPETKGQGARRDDTASGAVKNSRRSWQQDEWSRWKIAKGLCSRRG